MRARIGVLGAGAWGTAMAKVIAEKGEDVSPTEIWTTLSSG